MATALALPTTDEDLARVLAMKIIKQSATKPSARWGLAIPEAGDKEIGNRLLKLRKKHGIKQQDLADRMRKKSSTICNLEAGRFRWTLELVLAYIREMIALCELQEKNSEPTAK